MYWRMKHFLAINLQLFIQFIIFSISLQNYKFIILPAHQLLLDLSPKKIISHFCATSAEKCQTDRKGIKIYLSQIYMSQKRSEVSVQNLHTNSTIQIQSDVDSEELMFCWRRKHSTSPYTFNHFQWVENLGNQYTCSPLDYECEIELRIYHDGEYQYFKYGPIKLQGQLQTNLQTRTKEKLHMKSQYRVHLVKEPNLSLLIQKNKGQKTSFRLDVGERSLNPETSLLWEPKQEGQKASVMIVTGSEKLSLLLDSQMDKYSNVDGYVEVIFGSRADRDLFMCEVMQYNGVKFPITTEMEIEEEVMMILGDEPPRMQSSIVFDQSALQSPSNALYESRKQENAFLNMGSLERDMQELIQSDSDTSPEEVIQDIYQILYTPTASKNISVQVEKSQRVNIHNDHPEASKKKISELQKTLKHNEYVTLLNSCKSEFGHVNDMNSHDTRSKRNSRIIEESMEMSRPTIFQNSMKSWARPPSNMYLDPNNLCQTRELREDQTVIRQSKQRIQLEPETNVSFHHGNQNGDVSLEEKINYLTKLNMYLLEQNQRLKEENKKLRANGGEVDLGKSEFTKIKQIKKLISDMANRIAFLEGMTFAQYRVMNGSSQQSRSLFKQKSNFPPPFQFSKPNQTSRQNNEVPKGSKPPSSGFKKAKKQEVQEGRITKQEKMKSEIKKPPLVFKQRKSNLKTKQSPEKPAGSPLMSVKSQKAIPSGHPKTYRCPDFIMPESRRRTQGSTPNGTVKQPLQPFQQAIPKAQSFLSVPKASGNGETLPSSPTYLSFGGKK